MSTPADPMLTAIPLTLARTVLDLGKQHRATLHPDGTPESVTTHSRTLALVALEMYARHPQGLDQPVFEYFSAPSVEALAAPREGAL